MHFYRNPTRCKQQKNILTSMVNFRVLSPALQLLCMDLCGTCFTTTCRHISFAVLLHPGPGLEIVVREKLEHIYMCLTSSPWP